MPASAQEIILRCDAAQTAADFTLSDTLHTVHGSFQGTRGEIHFDPALEKVSGEIVFDAISGHSGNAGRDRKMLFLRVGDTVDIDFRAAGGLVSSAVP
jgi:polyisoprenoid-binding protein YceI